ncbi:MAG: mannose-1-phosphate guanylyltransferase [Rhodopirellula sp.]|nr:mannose-1-phosphate guanylyltransferase [Rhodopirellula sp.]
MLYAVIMAGGSGTRLWPESRSQQPKQLLKIQGERTMLQQAVDRLGGLVPPERILIATTESLAGRAHEQVSQLPREAILAEPCPRNTAPCIGLAAIRILREDSEGTMAVLPADQVIEPGDRFREGLRLAERLVEQDPQRLITFGIRPTYASQSFGYIEAGGRLEALETAPGTGGVHHVARFHEKPDGETAAKYLAAGNFLWNAGIFVWKARTVMEALARYEPALHAHLMAIAAAADRADFHDVLHREFAAIDKISIDYAVMERASKVVVIEAPFDWDDVGSWRALERLRRPDTNGNVLDAARSIEIATTGTIARCGDPNHAVVLVGVKDLVVVVTPDATLVADKNSEESIRQVIEQLKARGWTEYL